MQKDKTIHILHFADIHDIRPIYFDKTYHVIPEAGGDKAYELLRRCMKEENTVAIAKEMCIRDRGDTSANRYPKQ